MTEHNLRVLGWAMPGACMALSAFLFLSQAGHLREANGSRDKAALILDQAMTNRTRAMTSQKQKLVAVAAENADEETTYLRDLRSRVVASGARIIKWSSISRPAGEPDKQTNEIDPVLRDVTAIGSELTLGGDFKTLCAWLKSLDGANRLFTISNISWNRSKETGTTLTCTLTRYTRPPKADLVEVETPSKS